MPLSREAQCTIGCVCSTVRAHPQNTAWRRAQVKDFYFYHVINRHEMTTLTPSYHAGMRKATATRNWRNHADALLPTPNAACTYPPYRMLARTPAHRTVQSTAARRCVCTRHIFRTSGPSLRHETLDKAAVPL